MTRLYIPKDMEEFNINKKLFSIHVSIDSRAWNTNHFAFITCNIFVSYLTCMGSLISHSTRFVTNYLIVQFDHVFLIRGIMFEYYMDICCRVFISSLKTLRISQILL